MGTGRVAHDPSAADGALSHEVRKRRRATSPRYAQGGKSEMSPAFRPE